MRSAITLLIIILIFAVAPNYQLVQATTIQDEQKITAQILLDRWAEALGGREKLKTINTIHSEGSIAAAGLKGTIEDYQTMSAQHRTNINLADLYKSISIFNIDKGWIIDESNVLRDLAGNELKGEITTQYLTTFSYLIPGRLPGKVEYQGEDSAKKYYVLKIVPQGGEESIYYLDKRTYLPVKEESGEGAEASITYYSDWRDVAGIKFSFEQRQLDNKGELNNLVNLNKIILNSEIAQDIFNKPAEAANRYKFDQGQSALNIPFEMIFNCIFLKVNLNNGAQPLNFILDTGAGISCIEEGLAKKLALKSKGKIKESGVGEAVGEASLIPNTSLRLPGISLTDMTIYTTSLSDLNKYEGIRIDGILGYDFISQFVVEVDYAHKTVSLYDAKSYQYNGKGEVFPITLEANIPNVTAKITTLDGKTLDIHCHIDTGSTADLDITRPFIEANQLLKSSQKMLAGSVRGVGGESKSYEARLKSLQMGSFNLESPIAGLSLSQNGNFASANYDANLGGGIFKRFKMIFNYQHKQIILEPNEHLNDPFEFDMSGLRLIATGKDYHTFVVEDMREESPALEIGIHKGDVIVDIDGKPLANLRLHQVNEIFKQEGKEYDLTVRRGKRLLKFKLKLRKLI